MDVYGQALPVLISSGMVSGTCGVAARFYRNNQRYIVGCFWGRMYPQNPACVGEIGLAMRGENWIIGLDRDIITTGEENGPAEKTCS